MPAGEIHVNDNLFLQLTVLNQDGSVVNLAPATAMQITFQPPNSLDTSASLNTFTRNLSLLTDGTDGNVFYTFASGELSLAGYWKFQGVIQGISGTFYTDTTNFKVFDNIITA